MKVLYAGSFNPWHKGHQYVYDRAAKYFGRENIIVGIGCNPDKALDAKFIKWTMAPLGINVQMYSILTSDFCKVEGIDLLVRGIRPGRSLEYEEELMYWNMKLGGVETIFIPTPPEINQISSSVIRELTKYHHCPYDYTSNEAVANRWMQHQIPYKELIFGRTCSGKSTYLKVNYKAECILDMDVAIWEHLDTKTNCDRSIQKKLKELFIAGDMPGFKRVFNNELLPLIDWYELMEGHDVVDMAALGSFINHIPLDLLAQYRLIKVDTSAEDRERNRIRRGWNEETFRKLDSLYQEPPYWDETINL